MTSYDDRQADLPLRQCQQCGRAYYMTAVVCARCGPGFRTVQLEPHPPVDVSDHALTGP